MLPSIRTAPGEGRWAGAWPCGNSLLSWPLSVTTDFPGAQENLLGRNVASLLTQRREFRLMSFSVSWAQKPDPQRSHLFTPSPFLLTQHPASFG